MESVVKRSFETGSHGWWERRVRALRVVLPVFALAVLPFLFEGVFLAHAARSGILAIDFKQTFLPASQALASGHSPYPAYGYPPLVAFALVPLTFVPAPSVVFTILVALCVPAALWLLDVRDWRCFGAAFLWAPVFHGIQTANVTLPLLLAAACCWHFRDRPRPAAISAGLGIAAKLICWPIAVWLAATRRSRTAVGAVAVAVVVTFGLWATIGFSGLLDYPSSTNGLQEKMAPGSYTLKAVALDAGLPSVVGTALALGLAVAALVLCVAYGRRRDDRRSFSFAVLACVVASPIVWLHSFAFLLAPVALFRPRFSALWLLPVVLLAGSGTGNGAPWQTALVLGVMGFVFCASVVRVPWSRSSGYPTRPHVPEPAPSAGARV
jgi:Glycosyltransferase family 87